MLFLSFGVHFTTAAMYYFMALAIGAVETAEFWPIVFGSSIQILATVHRPLHDRGLGHPRGRPGSSLLGSLIGPAAAIVSATARLLGRRVPDHASASSSGGSVRGPDYKPAYCRVDGEQVDYEEAAKAATSLETEEERAQPARHCRSTIARPPLHGAGRAS